MQIRIGGAWVSPTVAKAFISGAWRTPFKATVYKGGAWHDCATFVLPMTVALSGGYNSTTQTVGPVSATPTGGRAPFTYLYTVISAPVSVTVGTPSAASTYFYTSSTTSNAVCTIRVKVTDSLGTQVTADHNITFNRDTFTGGTA